MYIDGHEPPDVVAERISYLDCLHAIESLHLHLPPPLPFVVLQSEQQPVQIGNTSASKKVVTIYHDESTFQSNDDQRVIWSQPDQYLIKPKFRRSGKMVSDFIKEYGGYLRLSPEEFARAKLQLPSIAREARQITEYGENRDEYWTNDKF